MPPSDFGELENVQQSHSKLRRPNSSEY